MTPSPLIIGVDAGTSYIKAVAFTTTGEQVALAQRANVYWRTEDGGVEQDMTRTFDDTAAVLAELVARLPQRGAGVMALAVTGQGDGTWLVDVDGEPVAPAWLWLDARSGDLTREMMAAESFPRHYGTTGTGISTCQQSVHFTYMKRHRPELLRRAATAQHCKDWLYFRLTDIRATDPSEACYTFGDFRTRQYCDEVLADFGLRDERRLLPPIVDGVSQSHPMTARAAAATGLRKGLPVILGYVDFAVTALGGGLMSEEGDVGCSILGSTGMHLKLVSGPDAVTLNDEMSGFVLPFPAPPKLTQIQSNMAATLNIDWMLDMAADVLKDEGAPRGRAHLVGRLDERVLAAEPIGALYHPHISEAGERGPFLDPFARAQFTGLHSSLKFWDLMRAVLEGLAFAARDCYAASGPIPREIRLTGGGSRSMAMRRILASVLARPVRLVAQEEAGAAGAAMIAAVQQGVFSSMEECARVWTTPRLSEPTMPDEGLVEPYARAFELYRDIRKDMGPIWQRLDRIRRSVPANPRRTRP